MATVTAVLMLVVGVATHVGQPALPAIGCFVGMFVLVQFTSVGKSFGGSGRRAAQRDLPRSQRREVVRAVRQGRAVANPDLAPAAVELARDWQRVFAPRPRREWWLIGPPLAAALAVLAAVRGSTGGAWFFGSCTALSVLVAPLRRRMRRRAEAAALANESLRNGA
jgi:hypothetical protein